MRRPGTALAMAISVLAAGNIAASSLLGLGDAEALYYCYGQHPSMSYLDHPPLVGWLIAASTSIGGPRVLAVRAVSLTMTALSLVFTYLLTRELFGRRAAGWSALLMLGTPAFSIGMVAASPDAPLSALWPLFTWQLVLALEDQRPGAWPRLGRPIALGAILGLAFLAKYTGACLVITAGLAVMGPDRRGWLKRPGFWLGLATAGVVASPVFLWNIENDWAGLYHRLIWTQRDAGFSLGNLGSLVGGQLLYIGPPMLFLLGWAGAMLWRERGDRGHAFTLLAASAPALILTYLLVAWSDVAEPHWPAAGYLPLFCAAAGLITRTAGPARRLAKIAVGFGVVVLAAAHILVLTPLLPAMLPQDSYEPRYDLGNELRGWPEVAEAVRALDPAGKTVVAGFYTQCGQLAFALARPDDPPVRCASSQVDDFDIWYGRFDLPAQGAIFVTDNRFDHEPSNLIPGSRVAGSPIALEITRGGRWVRRFEIVEILPLEGDKTGGDGK